MAKKGYWQVEFTLSLDGKDVEFDDLSEETRKHIIEEILDGYTGGEIEEETED